MHELPEVIARGDGNSGEVVLRRRIASSGLVHELIINGTFLMDTAETSTEQLLADAFLERHPAPRRVLVGGLGLGFTLASLLADARVDRINVVEIEPLLIDWIRAGLVPGTEHVVADPRVVTTTGDINDVLRTAPPAGFDGILLDVDNGPGFLVRETNAAVYEPPSLGAAADALAPDGILAIWAAAPAPYLASALADVVGEVTELVRSVRREGRQIEYYVYLARRRAGRPAP
ncbi:spermidine synthase [Phytoactinopolyspora limicola]|uniref:spermine/spermidine synthase domain-containing protein n=1 Tax=Phytoactinopolyspora limicola TaxID=2715536 RepID=UPI001A9C39C9|nr:spermidine synthase [Phytoactinopolyspora limicola]